MSQTMAFNKKLDMSNPKVLDNMFTDYGIAFKRKADDFEIGAGSTSIRFEMGADGKYSMILDSHERQFTFKTNSGNVVMNSEQEIENTFKTMYNLTETEMSVYKAHGYVTQSREVTNKGVHLVMVQQ